MGEGWRTFDHTGDLGLEVWAPTPARLFEQALVALMRQVAEVPAGGSDRPSPRVSLELEGDDAADLFVHWLKTGLLEAELHHAIWTRASIARWSPRGLTAELEGPRYEAARHIALREVKAVSHHGLELRLDPPECRCRMVLDL